jgi:hypothetical protein
LEVPKSLHRVRSDGVTESTDQNLNGDGTKDTPYTICANNTLKYGFDEYLFKEQLGKEAKKQP